MSEARYAERTVVRVEPAAPTAAPKAEAERRPNAGATRGQRFVELLKERRLIEVAPDEGFVAEVSRALRMKANASIRAHILWSVLEKHPAVIEFYLLEKEDLAAILEEWG